MAKAFVLREEVEDLTWDFGPEDGSGPKGVVPEPSSDQIRAFRRAIGEWMQVVMGSVADMAGVDATKLTPQAMMDTLSKFLNAGGDEKADKLDDELMHAMADLCSDKPSIADLELIGYRGQQAFLGWLMGTFLVPEALRSVTKN